MYEALILSPSLAIIFNVVTHILVLKVKDSYGLYTDNIINYFPSFDGTTRDIVWMKANTKEELETVLQMHPMFLECDVLFLYQTVRVVLNDNISDLKLEEWLIQVLQHRVGLLITLHDTSTVEPTLSLLQMYKIQIGKDRPLWISANILPSNGSEAVDFIALLEIKKVFPRIVLSVGWTILSNATTYLWNDIWDMLKLLEKYKTDINVNFKFKLSLLYTSKAQIQFLMDMFPNCTITLFSISPNDSMDVNQLLQASAKFDQRRLFYNVPKQMQLNHNAENEIVTNRNSQVMSDIWQIKNASSIYIGSKTFIASLDSAKVTSKLRYGTPDNRSFIIEGKLSTFGFSGPTLMKIGFIDKQKNPFLTCFFSNNISGGCLPEWVERNSTQVHDSCFIFQIIINDMASNSTIVNNVRFDACSIDREYELSTFITSRVSSTNNSKAIVTSDKSYHHEASTLGNVINSFDGMSVSISVQPKIGYAVYEDILILSNRNSSDKLIIPFCIILLMCYINLYYNEQLFSNK